MKTAIEHGAGTDSHQIFFSAVLHSLLRDRAMQSPVQDVQYLEKKSPEMSIGEMEQCANVLKSLKSQQFIITGGEPLLRPAWQ